MSTYSELEKFERLQRIIRENKPAFDVSMRLSSIDAQIQAVRYADKLEHSIGLDFEHIKDWPQYRYTEIAHNDSYRQMRSAADMLNSSSATQVGIAANIPLPFQQYMDKLDFSFVKEAQSLLNSSASLVFSPSLLAEMQRFSSPLADFLANNRGFEKYLPESFKSVDMATLGAATNQAIRKDIDWNDDTAVDSLIQDISNGYEQEMSKSTVQEREESSKSVHVRHKIDLKEVREWIALVLSFLSLLSGNNTININININRYNIEQVIDKELHDK